MLRDLFPHILCEYLYDLSCAFTDFYEQCRVIDVDADGVAVPNSSRVLLCRATASVLAKGFDLLGLAYVDKM